MIAFIEAALANSFTYSQYRSHVSHLLVDGLSTGNTQSEDLTHYSTLNEVRMNRLDKTVKVPEEIEMKLINISKKFTLLVISEGWCGDAAQILPVISKLADKNENLDFRIVLRDKNIALMDEYLTNGARSIPKLILIEAGEGVVRGSWGPRPMGAANLVKEYKERYGVFTEEAKTELQKWYLQDKGISTMEELTLLLETANAIE